MKRNPFKKFQTSRNFCASLLRCKEKNILFTFSKRSQVFYSKTNFISFSATTKKKPRKRRKLNRKTSILINVTFRCNIHGWMYLRHFRGNTLGSSPLSIILPSYCSIASSALSRLQLATPNSRVTLRKTHSSSPSSSTFSYTLLSSCSVRKTPDRRRTISFLFKNNSLSSFFKSSTIHVGRSLRSTAEIEEKK